MHAVDLIASALSGKATDRLGRPVEIPALPSDHVCCVTGVVAPCVPRRLCIGESFTTQGIFAAPDSAWIGVNAYVALKHGKESLSSWWCDGTEFRLLDRAAARQMLLSHPMGSHWCGYITTSFKKHGCLVAPVNHYNRTAGWAFETEAVYNSDIWFRILQGTMLRYRDLGITRAAIQSGGCDEHTSGDAASWMAFQGWARQQRNSGIYRLAAYLLPGKEKQ